MEEEALKVNQNRCWGRQEGTNRTSFTTCSLCQIWFRWQNKECEGEKAHGVQWEETKCPHGFNGKTWRKM